MNDSMDIYKNTVNKLLNLLIQKNCVKNDTIALHEFSSLPKEDTGVVQVTGNIATSELDEITKV